MISDDDYIDMLISECSNPLFSAIISKSARSISVKEEISYAEKQIGEKLEQAIAEEVLDDLIKERQKDDKFASFLNHGARKICMDCYKKDLYIKPFMLNSMELNAFATISPNGTYLVGFNRGVLMLLDNFVKLSMEIYNLGADDSDDANKRQLLCARAAFGIAKYISTGDNSELMMLFSLTGKGVINEYSGFSYITTMSEFFIFLHEYGHIMLGHLKENGEKEIIVNRRKLFILSNHHRMEYQADMFAFKTLARSLKKSGNERAVTDAALAAGLVLKLFELCELIQNVSGSSSHPPAANRWGRIARAAHLEKHKLSIAGQLDALFEPMKVFRD